MDQPKPVSASVILESRSLRAELRVTVDTGRSLFVNESLLTRLQLCAEECLPVALASVAPQALQQVLQKCEEQLLARIDLDVSSDSPQNKLLRELRDTSVPSAHAISKGE